MLDLGKLPEGIDPSDIGAWLLRCSACAKAVPIWEAKGKDDVKKCPKCRATLTPFTTKIPVETVPPDAPGVPPMQTMRALLLQALMGSSLDPLVQAIDKFGGKIDLLTAEMKTRNKIEETKIVYNKALDDARLLIKKQLREQEQEKKDAKEEGKGTDNS